MANIILYILARERTSFIPDTEKLVPITDIYYPKSYYIRLKSTKF